MANRLRISLIIKRLFFAALLMGVSFQVAYGQTTLSPGELVIITVNADTADDGNKSFDFVPLVDLESGTEIKFTDAAYIESIAELDTNEGTVTFEASTDIDAGSVVTFTGSDGNGFTQNGAFNPSASGDNIIVFQGERNDPTFLFGVGWARGSSVWDYDSQTSPNNRSDVPPGLREEDHTILSLGTTDNYQYNGENGLEGTTSSLLSLIGDHSNWNEDDDYPFSPFSSSFTLVNLPTLAFASEVQDGEEGSSVNLSVELVESNSEVVSVDVVFLEEASTADETDIDGFSTETVTFASDASNGTTQNISIPIGAADGFEGKEKAVFQLQNNTKGTLINPRELTLTINDSENPNIVINEIHADPEEDADGNGETDSRDDEFVEFVNNSSSDIDMSGWTFSDVDNVKHTFPGGTVIPANRALVLFGDNDISVQGNFGGAIVQRSNESPTLSLNNSGDTVVLADENGTVVAEVAYGSEADDGQAITRDPDISGDFVKHSEASDSDGVLFSPGTKINGQPFGSKHAVAIRGTEGWRVMSSPVQNSTFDDLFGDIWMQGLTNSDDPSGNSTLFTWSEVGGGTYTLPGTGDMNDQLKPGKGYIVYVFEDDQYSTSGIQGGFPKIISTDKDENTGTVQVPVSATDENDSGSIDGDEGYNLLGNPFDADISAAAVYEALKGVDASANANIYVWDHRGNNGNGKWITIDGESDDTIAPFQAFFIRYSAEVSGNVEFNRNDLVVNKGTRFYKEIENQNAFSFDLELHGDQYFDEYSLTFSEKGKAGLDNYDGFKLFSLNPSSINLYSIQNNNRIQKNVLPRELESAISIPLSFDAPKQDLFTFRWNTPRDLPNDWDILLVDNERNREIDMRVSNKYEFEPVDTEEQNQSSVTKDKKGLLNKTNDTDEPRFTMSVEPKTAENESDNLPESVKLNPNYPNPFTSVTTIPFELSENAEVTLTVWNMIGQKVATLVDGEKEAGEHTDVRWNASDMPSGMYIARFEVGNEVYTRKMTLIK